MFALLVTSAATFARPHVALRRWAHPRVRVIGARWFAAPPVAFVPYEVPVPYPYPVPYPEPYPVWNFIASLPAYTFLDSGSPMHPQLVFKDGTTYTVTDYWRADDQLHFITTEEGGTKSVPHIVPFGDLDIQKTTDTNTAEGFRFVLRDEPVEQWLEHHAQHEHRPARHQTNEVKRHDPN